MDPEDRGMCGNIVREGKRETHPSIHPPTHIFVLTSAGTQLSRYFWRLASCAWMSSHFATHTHTHTHNTHTHARTRTHAHTQKQTPTHTPLWLHICRHAALEILLVLCKLCADIFALCTDPILPRADLTHLLLALLSQLALRANVL